MSWVTVLPRSSRNSPRMSMWPLHTVFYRENLPKILKPKCPDMSLGTFHVPQCCCTQCLLQDRPQRLCCVLIRRIFLCLCVTSSQLMFSAVPCSREFAIINILPRRLCSFGYGVSSAAFANCYFSFSLPVVLLSLRCSDCCGRGHGLPTFSFAAALSSSLVLPWYSKSSGSSLSPCCFLSPHSLGLFWRFSLDRFFSLKSLKGYGRFQSYPCVAFIDPISYWGGFCHLPQQNGPIWIFLTGFKRRLRFRFPVSLRERVKRLQLWAQTGPGLKPDSSPLTEPE